MTSFFNDLILIISDALPEIKSHRGWMGRWRKASRDGRYPILRRLLAVSRVQGRQRNLRL